MLALKIAQNVIIRGHLSEMNVKLKKTDSFRKLINMSYIFVKPVCHNNLILIDPCLGMYHCYVSQILSLQIQIRIPFYNCFKLRDRYKHYNLKHSTFWVSECLGELSTVWSLRITTKLHWNFVVILMSDTE